MLCGQNGKSTSDADTRVVYELVLWDFFAVDELKWCGSLKIAVSHTH